MRAPVCIEDEFVCRSGECIDKSLRCNLYKDCDDGSDEDNCKYDGICFFLIYICNFIISYLLTSIYY